MGAEHVRELLREKPEYDREAPPRKVDADRVAGRRPRARRTCRASCLEHERVDLEDQVKNGKGQKQARAVKRLKVLSRFLNSEQQARDDGPRGRAGDPAGAAPDGPARRRPLRDVGPQRPLPPRHQPQQPPQAAARPRRARDHRQQREAHAAGGRRRAVRQRPPRPPRHRPGQPPAEVAQRHAQGQAGPLPPEPARQARRLLGPLGHRGRPVAAAAPVRPAEADGPRAVQAVHHGPARRAQGRAEHQGGQEDGRLDDPARSGTSSSRSSTSTRCCSTARRRCTAWASRRSSRCSSRARRSRSTRSSATRSTRTSTATRWRSTSRSAPRRRRRPGS